MSTAYQTLKINGVISTDKTVLQNLNDIATASAAFISYDVSQGKWAVVINKTGVAAATYDDSNIIGSITVSETGVRELYNSISVEYPHRDLRDDKDYVDISIASGDRYPNEVEKNLPMVTDLINDPLQAQYIGTIELKQSRLSKIIEFTTDYTSLGLKAGQLIEVTNTLYDFDAKMFRIQKIEEIDDDGIYVKITALEYDSTIYDDTGLVVSARAKNTGILLKQVNTAIQTSDDVETGNQLQRLLLANAGAFLLKSLFSRLGGNLFGPSSTTAEDVDKILSNAKRPPLDTISSSAAFVCEGSSVSITVGYSCSSCLFNIPDFDYTYLITGVSAADINKPLTGTIKVSNGTGTIVIGVNDDGVAEGTETLTFTCGGLSVVLPVYERKDYTYSLSKSSASITEGQSVTINITTTGSKLNATIPYQISGSAVGKITTPLSGDITVVGGSASLLVETTDDAGYTGTQGFTFILEPSLTDPCNSVGSNSTSVSVLDNDTAPPAPTPDFNCYYTQVPLVWCGVYDGDDYQLKDITVRQYVFLPEPIAGEATINVPLTVSVTKGNPSTITVTSTATVAAASVNVGGNPVRIITSFDSIGPRKLITGTTVTLYGY